MSQPPCSWRGFTSLARRPEALDLRHQEQPATCRQRAFKAYGSAALGCHWMPISGRRMVRQSPAVQAVSYFSRCGDMRRLLALS